MTYEVSITKVPPHKAMINKMLEVEAALANVPSARFGDDCGPLEHTFADGLYVRQFSGLKNTIVVSKLHKTNHPYFVLKGDVSVLTDKGSIRIKAPHWGITKAGTKRILYFHEDTVWITVHATEETDLEKIEEVVIAKTYNELPEYVKKSFEGKPEFVLEEREVPRCLGQH